MKERERVIVSGLVVLMLWLWLGFLVHQSPRFPGSFWGGVLGVAGATLMMAPLLYSFIKRIEPLKQVVTKRVAMRVLLKWHIYAGILGPILALLHTGHKFDSVLGIALTAMMLIVVVSGFTGRYLMSQISEEIREKQSLLDGLMAAYRRTTDQVALCPHPAGAGHVSAGFFRPFYPALFVRQTAMASECAARCYQAYQLAESISDVEYAIKNFDLFKKLFSRWLKLHIVLSAILYILLALHIWGAIYFGIRWFD